MKGGEKDIGQTQVVLVYSVRLGGKDINRMFRFVSAKRTIENSPAIYRWE